MAELAAVMMVVSSVASVGATLVGGAAQMWTAEAESINQSNAMKLEAANAEAKANQLQAANSINQARAAEVQKREMLDLQRTETKPSVLALVREKQLDDRSDANYQAQTGAAALRADAANLKKGARQTLSAAKSTGRLAMLGAGAQAAGQAYSFSRDYVRLYDNKPNKYG